MKTKPILEGEIHIGGRTAIIPQEVIYLKADINYTKVLLSDGKKITVATTLKSMESRFESFPKLVRVNKSTIINIDCIRQKEEGIITLQNGEKIIASRRRKKAFFELMNF